MLPWTQTSKELVFTSPLFRFFRAGFRSPSTGKEGKFDVLETKDWVNIVAVTPDDELLMVRQFRYGTAELTLEFPAGCVEPGEPPLDTAIRELAEETGARGEGWAALGSCHPNPAFLNNRCHHFLVKNAKVVAPVSFDEHEEIELVRVPAGDVDRLIADGTISHALSIVSWQFYRSSRNATCP